MNINGIDLNFDFTSPTDMMRYRTAATRLAKRAAEIPDLPTSTDDPQYMEKYIDMLNGTLKVYGDFVDEVFGDGTANKLLGDNPSMAKVLEIRAAIDEALEQEGRKLGAQMAKYIPNRAEKE